MKQLTLPTILGLAVVIAGCVTTSVHPFYTDQDVVSDPALLGRWEQLDEKNQPGQVWEFKPGSARDYLFVSTESKYRAHLFKLEGQAFLDLFPDKPAPSGDYVPVHQLYRVDQVTPALLLAPLDYGWLARLLEQDKGALQHVVIEDKQADGTTNSQMVLTAPTKALQAFVLKHRKTPEAWSKVQFNRKPGS